MTMLALHTRAAVRTWAATISMASFGCGATAAPPATRAPSSPRVLIAQPCAEVPAENEAAGGYGRVFIQLAQVASRNLQHPLETWLPDHPVAAPSLVSFVGTQDVPATVSWSRCLDEDCVSTEPWMLTVRPMLPARASDVVRLTARSSRAQEATERMESTTLELRNQQPAQMPLPGATDESLFSVVITPYLVGSDDDLRRLAQCKSNAGAAQKPD